MRGWEGGCAEASRLLVEGLGCGTGAPAPPCKEESQSVAPS